MLASTPHQRADCHLPLRNSITNMVQGLISHGYTTIGLFQCSSSHFVGDDGNRPAGVCVHDQTRDRVVLERSSSKGKQAVPTGPGVPAH